MSPEDGVTRSDSIVHTTCRPAPAPTWWVGLSEVVTFSDTSGTDGLADNTHTWPLCGSGSVNTMEENGDDVVSRLVQS